MISALRYGRLGFASLLALAACGGSAPPKPAPPPAPTVASPAASAPASQAPAQTQEAAHKLFVLAAGCWFGGLWSDALGEQEEVKRQAAEARCHDLERRVWGVEDKARYEQLRALETKAVADVVAKVDETAKGDSVDGPRREALLKLATALADAQKELMAARRAGDRVKRDLTREPEKLSTDEVDAVMPLRAHARLDALLKMDAGDLTKEAHALGVLCAMDRIEITRGLPMHLKFYAAADTFNLLFGVTVPDVPEDATKKLVPGTWLKFLVDTAAAAGHPVPDKAKTPKDRNAMAWAGMLEGFSDKLKGDAEGIASTTDLAKVVTVTLHRLEAEYHAQQGLEATREATQKPPKK